MLDPLTTLFMTALTTAVCGIILLGCCSRGGNAPLLIWAVAMIVAAAGLVVAVSAGGQGGMLDDIATATLISACALFWTATRLFRGAKLRWALAIAGPALWLATAELRTQSHLWTAAACTIGGGYTAASLREFFLLRSERLASWSSAVVLMAAHVTVYLVRVTLAVGADIAPDQVVAPSWIGVALVAEAMIHINGSAIVLVALSLERHESRTSRNLRVAAYQDGLTGIANRRRFDERLDELSSDLRLRTGLLGLIMLDLDRFKAVNDTAGHDEGDRILRIVAQLIAVNVRAEVDLAARYGGEEFAVVVADANLDHLGNTAERIRAAVETAAIPHPGTGGVITISASVGLIAATELSAHRHEFVTEIDHALYEAKRLGRNRVVFTDARLRNLPPRAAFQPIHAA